jgi:uncharacterized membrane protein
MVDLIFGRLFSKYRYKAETVTDKEQGAALIIGSAFMLGSRLLHDKDLRKKW